MLTIYLKRRPDGSPDLEGPRVKLPDTALYVHRQAAGWIARAVPDLGDDGATLLAFIEGVDGPGAPEWGDLLGTMRQGSGDRAAIVRRRLEWLQGQSTQAVDRIGAAIIELTDASRLTPEERGN